MSHLEQLLESNCSVETHGFLPTSASPLTLINWYDNDKSRRGGGQNAFKNCFVNERFRQKIPGRTFRMAPCKLTSNCIKAITACRQNKSIDKKTPPFSVNIDNITIGITSLDLLTPNI